MFNNIGKKIKTLAVVIFVLELIGVFIVGLVTMIGGAAGASIGIKNSGVFGLTGFIGGLIIWIVGFLSSWICSFFLYGFGELIDKTAENAQNTKRIADQLSFGNLPPVSAPNVYRGGSVQAQPVYQAAPVQAPSPAPVNADKICGSCGVRNDPDAGFCVNCGKTLN